MTDIEVPARYVYVPDDMPRGEAYNVGQMYTIFGQAIRSGQACQPYFEEAVAMHQLIDTVRSWSDQGKELAVAAAARALE